MGRADYLRLGDFNAICYQCGFKRKASEMEKNWQGYYVCPEHNEPRQTQDFVRAIPDVQTTPWAQPDPLTVYTYTQARLGVFDGVNRSFQFGSGLGSDAVLYNVLTVYVNGSPVLPTRWIVSAQGVITITSLALHKGDVISSTGTETVLA
jgi:hypothetical protein